MDQESKRFNENPETGSSGGKRETGQSRADQDTGRLSGIPHDARKWSMACHLIALSGLIGNGIGFLLGPLIVWLVKKDDHPFIDEQGREALNFQITMFIALLASALLALVVIGFLLLAVVAVLMVVFPIVGAVRANDGQHFRYPLTIRFF